MKCAIYCRVSTDEQADNTSLGSQEQACRNYAENRGLEVYQVYRDDYTGSRIDRPELQNMLTAMRAGEFGAVVVNEISRWGRDERVLLDLKYILMRSNIELHIVTFGRRVDFNNPFENYMYQNMSNFSVMWKQMIIQYMTNGKWSKAIDDRKPVMTGHPPYGYRRIGRGKTSQMVIDEREAEVVRMIFEWYTRGENGARLSLRAIALRLEEMRIPTPHYRKNAANYWIPATIRGIISNTIYAGETHYGKTAVVEDYERDKKKRVKNPPEKVIRIPVPELAIIDRATFEQAQTIGARNLETSRRNQRNEYLMTGYFRCGNCGKAMAGSFTAAHGYKNLYYRCGNHWHRPEQEPCANANRSIDAGKIENAIWNWLVSIFSDDSALEDGLAGMRERKEAELQPKLSRLEHLQYAIAEQDKVIARYMRQLGGNDSDDLAALIKKQVQQEIEAKNRMAVELEELERAINGIEVSPEMEKELRQLIVLIRDNIATPKPGVSVFAAKRQIFEMVNLRVIFQANESGRWLEASCGLSNDVIMLPLSSGSFPR